MAQSILSINENEQEILIIDLVKSLINCELLESYKSENDVIEININKKDYINAIFYEDKNYGEITINGYTYFNPIFNRPEFEGFPLWYLSLHTLICGIFGQDVFEN